MEKSKVRDLINLFLSAGLEPVIITSLDLRLSGEHIEMLFDGPAPGEEIRAEAVKKEILNPSINLRQDDLAYQ